LIATSCENEDDIEEIFWNKNWKITGATINGTSINSEALKELYASAQSYYLIFSAGTMKGFLSPNCPITGAWSANGKNHDFHCDLNVAENINESALNLQLYEILNNAKKYNGDGNVLRIEVDSRNFIRLTVKNNI
jgi:signal transduction histidine kinase